MTLDERGGVPNFEAYIVQPCHHSQEPDHPRVHIGIGDLGEAPVAVLDVCGTCLMRDIKRALQAGHDPLGQGQGRPASRRVRRRRK